MEFTWWTVLLGFSSICLAVFVKYREVRSFLRTLYLTAKTPAPTQWELLTAFTKVVFLGEDMATHGWKLCVAHKHKPWGMWSHQGFLLFISDCASVSDMFRSKNLIDRSGLLVNGLLPYAGTGIVTLCGPEHRLHRKFTGPAYRKSLLDSMLPGINEAAVKLVEMLEEKATGEEVDVRTLCEKQIAAAVLSLLGSNYVSPHLATEAVSRSTVLVKLTTEIHLQTINPLYYSIIHKRTKSYKKVQREFKEFLSSFRAACHEVYTLILREMEEGDDFTGDNFFVAIMRECLRTKLDYSFEELFEEIRNLTTAAFETTTSALNFSLVSLALHPCVQQKVFEEVDSVFGASDRPLLPEDLSKLVYLEMFIKEVLRMFPPVPMVDRGASEEAVIDGILVPKGTSVVANMVALHRNAEVFPDPLKFDPDRFSPESSQELPPYAYLPFGGGPRVCMGQLHAMAMLKITLSHIVRNFKIVPGKNLKTVDDLKTRMSFTFCLRESPLHFFSRKDHSPVMTSHTG